MGLSDAAAAAPRRAVLLMAYGGPGSDEEVEPFLRDVRGGRPTSPALVAEVRARYRAIGGGSPLLAITRAQAAALESELCRGAATSGEPPWRVWVGMRHWHPYIRQAVAEIAASGRRELVALCLAPQYSRMSIGVYFARLDEALAETAGPLRVTRVASWHDRPGFLDAVATEVAAGLGRFAPLPAAEVTVIFTAHSLPRRVIEAGDPYDRQLRETAREVAARAGRAVGADLDWTFCYQSVGAGGVDWLGPEIGRVIEQLAGADRRHLLAAPVGFVADHVEVLYDLDVEARRIAERCGARFERTASLNDSPRLVAALAEVVREAAGEV